MDTFINWQSKLKYWTIKKGRMEYYVEEKKRMIYSDTQKESITLVFDSKLGLAHIYYYKIVQNKKQNFTTDGFLFQAISRDKRGNMEYQQLRP